MLEFAERVPQRRQEHRKKVYGVAKHGGMMKPDLVQHSMIEAKIHKAKQQGLIYEMFVSSLKSKLRVCGKVALSSVRRGQPESMLSLAN
mmetsp:Transcript_35571/g.60118  ORF Transcript_35571/g.60118 Transcript_35571/m.60118 type:complete len:89 (+) Transcript_35571:404-670(+)